MNFKKNDISNLRVVYITIFGLLINLVTINKGFDSHHLGYKLRAAFDINQGKILYVDSYSWYQPFAAYFDALILRIFNNQIYFIIFIYSVVSLATGVLIYLIVSHFFSQLTSQVIFIIYILASPEIGVKIDFSNYSDLEFLTFQPWHGVLSRFFLALTIYCILKYKLSLYSVSIVGLFTGLTLSSVLVTGAGLFLSILLYLVIIRTKVLSVIVYFCTSITAFAVFYIPTYIKMDLVELIKIQLISPLSWQALSGSNILYSLHKFFVINFVPYLLIALILYFFLNLKYGEFPLTNYVKIILIISYYFLVGGRFHPTITFGIICVALLLLSQIIFNLFPKSTIKSILNVAVFSMTFILFLLLSLNNYSIWQIYILFLCVYPLACIIANRNLFYQNRLYYSIYFILLATTLRFYPVFEDRNIYWSGVLIGLFSGGLLFEQVNILGSRILIRLANLSISILIIVSVVSIFMRISLDYSTLSQTETLKHFKVETSKNSEYVKLLDVVSKITSNQKTPILFFGHNAGDSFIAKNLQTPNTYFPVPSAIKYNPKEFQDFILKFKPIIWFNGYPPSKDLAVEWMSGLNYCVLIDNDKVDKQPFYNLVLHYCGNQQEKWELHDGQISPWN
jgi:hypothetical protein